MFLKKSIPYQKGLYNLKQGSKLRIFLTYPTPFAGVISQPPSSTVVQIEMYYIVHRLIFNLIPTSTLLVGQISEKIVHFMIKA